MNKQSVLGTTAVVVGISLIVAAVAVFVSAFEDSSTGDSSLSESSAMSDAPTPGPTLQIGTIPGVQEQAGHLSASFVDSNYGWLSIDGSVLATEDGGVHWEERYSGPATGSQSIHFISRTTGWLVDGAGLFFTDDGGHTWTLVETTTPSRQDSLFHAVDFLDERQGFANVAINLEPAIMHTADGGLTWSALSTPCEQPMDLFSRPIEFIDDEVGWTICNYFPKAKEGPVLLMKTSDGGRTWELVGNLRAFVPGDDIATFASLRFTDEDNGWFGSENGGLYRTRDGGHTWEATATGGGSIYLVQPFADEELNITVAGGVLKTTDSGRTWSQIYPPSVVVADRPCTSQDLTAGLTHFGAATQLRTGGVVVTNISATPCTLSGRPTVEVVAPEGSVLPAISPGFTPEPVAVTLLPGQRAGVSLGWPTACQPEFSESTSLRLVFTDGEVVVSPSEFGDRGVAYCTDPPSGPGVGVWESARPPITWP